MSPKFSSTCFRSKIPTFIHLFSIYWLCLLSGRLAAQPEGTGCNLNSIHCWEKVYVKGGLYTCEGMATVFEDDFNGDPNSSYGNGLDDHLWQLGTISSSELNGPCDETLFKMANVNVYGGVCHLKGKHENVSWTDKWTDDDDVVHEVTYDREFSSASIRGHQNTDGHSYGRYEATVDLPGKGWWSSFWLWHHDEIDVYEWFSGDNGFLYNSYPSNKCDEPHSIEFDQPLTAGFHTYAVEWTPFKLTFFYDDVPLPKVVYRYYKLDGTPYDVPCNTVIEEGTYYENPNFPKDHRKREGTTFRPIVGMTVLPRYGLTCCPPNDFCMDPSCNGAPATCSDWGNPFFQNGDPRPGTSPNTEMLVDRVEVKKFNYRICGGLEVKLKEGFCLSETVQLTLQDLSPANGPHYANITSITTSPNLFALPQVLDTHGDIDDPHVYPYKPTAAGPAWIEISYVDDCGVARTERVITKIYDNNSVYCANAALDICNNQTNSECCPPNTYFDGTNCFYGTVPAGYRPWVLGGEFMVSPNCTVSTDNNCCPMGYQLIDSYCHSGIKFDATKYTGFILNNNYYVKPECGDISDCCPNGFRFDGVNCYSGITVPEGYNPLIYNHTFYVEPNCEISTANNCCPEGFIFNGVNCRSKTFPEEFEGFAYQNSFFTFPYCKDPNDCCPVGFTLGEDGKCKYKDQTVDPRYAGFGLHGTFYLVPNTEITEENHGCPPGFYFDGVNCMSNVSYPYHNLNPTVVDGYFAVDTHCPQDADCCPPDTYWDGVNCLVSSIPFGFNGYVREGSFYVYPNCQATLENNCCPPGFHLNSGRCIYDLVHVPSDLAGFTYGGNFYTTSWCAHRPEAGFETASREIPAPDLSSDVIAYPNPFDGAIFVSSVDPLMEVRLIDLYGRTVLQQTGMTDEWDLFIQTDELPAGPYFLYVNSTSGNKQIKLIKM